MATRLWDFTEFIVSILSKNVLAIGKLGFLSHLDQRALARSCFRIDQGLSPNRSVTWRRYRNWPLGDWLIPHPAYLVSG
jgi:hypothetical protein